MITIVVLIVIVSDDIKTQHHGIVFVHIVVAVNDITAFEIIKAVEHFCHVTRTEHRDILSRFEYPGWRLAIPFENLEFLEVNMHRVRP